MVPKILFTFAIISVLFTRAPSNVKYEGVNKDVVDMPVEDVVDEVKDRIRKTKEDAKGILDNVRRTQFELRGGFPKPIRKRIEERLERFRGRR